MDSLTHAAHLKLFHDRRLHPWLPEHALFIEAELAKLKVLDTHDYESFKEFYEQKMATYVEEHTEEIAEKEEPVAPVVVEEAEEIKPDAEIVEAEEGEKEVVEVVQKKRGRKPKIS